MVGLCRAALILSAAFLLSVITLSWWIDIKEDSYSNQTFTLMSFDDIWADYSKLLRLSQAGERPHDLQHIKTWFATGIMNASVDLNHENPDYESISTALISKLDIAYNSPTFAGNKDWTQEVLKQATLAQDLKDAGPLLNEFEQALRSDLGDDFVHIRLLKNYRNLLYFLLTISLGAVFVFFEMTRFNKKTPA